jgi:hypothetical protein
VIAGFLLFAVSLAIPQAASAQTCSPAPAGLVSWWSGDGNALDSRSRMNGTLLSGTTYTAGKVGQTFNFDGISGGVSVADSNVLDLTTDFTLEAWINPAALHNGTGQGGIISKVGGLGGNNGYQFGLTNNNTQLACQFNAMGEVWPGNQLIATVPGGIPLNTWSHVACTYDHANLTIYVNGASIGTLAVGPKTVINSSSGLRISGDDNNNVFFNGMIDEPSVYNRALSATEIAGIVNSGTAGKCKPTATVSPSGQVMWLAGDGDVNDISGNSNNGLLQGGAFWAAGKVGQGFTFGGVNGLIYVAHNANQNTGSFITIETWVNPTTLGHGRSILQKRSSSNIGGYFFESTGQPFAADNGLQFGLMIGGVYKVLATPANVLTTGVWQHVAATYDGATMKIYVNGIMQASMAQTGVVDAVPDPVVIGRNEVDHSLAWQGGMDEISLYNRALSQDEITSIVNAGLAGKLKTTTTSGTTATVGDVNLNFSSAASRTTQEIPLNSALFTLPAGFTATGLAYDIATSVTPTGSVNFCFHLPSFTDPNAFRFLKVLHANGSGFTDVTTGQNFSAGLLCGQVSSLSPFVIAQGAQPTAAPVTLSGRVVTDEGVPLGGVVMNLSGAAKVRTITDSNGQYKFANLASGEFYAVSPSLVNYTFAPATRSFSLTASVSDSIFAARADRVLTANPLDTTEFFVHQNYLDFLGREPDQGGLEYWSAQISQCNGDDACLRAKRIDVSNAFFYEQEFQGTGAFIYRVYQASFGQHPTYQQFMPDRTRVIGGPQLDQSKASFADYFVQQSDFMAQYPTSLTPAQCVDGLNANAGSSLTQNERDALVNDLAAGTETRGSVLCKMADNQAFIDREYNASFVLAQYFGYLRRNPDQAGFDFWLNQMNRFPIRDVAAQHAMVCSFITSREYQQRFSSVITHSNAECPH